MAFYSRNIDKPKVIYDIHDKEMLSIINSFKQWRHYHEGAAHMVLVYSDHKNLDYCTTTKVFHR